MNKIFKIDSYTKFLKRKYVDLFYSRTNPEQLESDQRVIFERLGLNYEFGIRKLREVLPLIGLSEYDERDGMMSQHWVIFSAISERLSPRGILEIGTFNGRTTSLLSKLFPESHIETVELPDDSPHFIGSYHRENTSIRERQIRERTQNLSQCANVTLNQINSFAIGQKLKDRSFDLIWIDGDHDYPAVAWDIFFGVSVLTKGGWLLADDFYLHPQANLLATYNTSFEAAQYLTIDGSIKPTYIHKRVYSRENIVKHKHILVIQG